MWQKRAKQENERKFILKSEYRAEFIGTDFESENNVLYSSKWE